MGFEPTRAEPNGLAVHRLNHSATSSTAYRIRLHLKTCEFYRFITLKLMTTQYTIRINERVV